ncbi:C39 family peptidase [Bacillus testis]|uniref:C39 family peptidase n=1 Tax=Bacillus testis TaxID=1622072 RepID=UPI000AAF2E59|nr:C39 family peptidase [Bacillus testis]
MLEGDEMKRIAAFFTKKNMTIIIVLFVFIVCAGVSLGKYLQNIILKSNDRSVKMVEPEKEELSSAAIEQLSNDRFPMDVPLVQQMPELPRGCEVTSLTMLLQYMGHVVDKMVLAKQIAHQPYNDNGFRGNMHTGFVGNMYTFDQPGLGVFVEPIIQLAQTYVGQNNVIDLTGSSPSKLYELLDKGIPIWVLTNVQFQPLSDAEFQTWKTKEGPMNVTYSQHSVILTGYTADHLYVNDPLQSRKNRVISRTAFEKSWIQMGSQAMAITEE